MCRYGWVSTGKKCVLCGENKLSPAVLALLILGTIVFVIFIKEVVSEWFTAPTTKGAESLKMLMKKKRNMARASGHCLYHNLTASIIASLFLSPPHRLAASITASLFLSLPTYVSALILVCCCSNSRPRQDSDCLHPSCDVNCLSWKCRISLIVHSFHGSDVFPQFGCSCDAQRGLHWPKRRLHILQHPGV